LEPPLCVDRRSDQDGRPRFASAGIIRWSANGYCRLGKPDIAGLKLVWMGGGSGPDRTRSSPPSPDSGCRCVPRRGLHEAIDYRTKDWTVELERLSQGKGVALITDPLGGNHWKKSYKALRSTGRLGMFAVSVATSSKLSGPLRLLPVALGMPFFHPLALMNANKSVFGVNLGHMWHETDMVTGWMEIMLNGVAEGWVRPHVDKSFPLAQVGEAQTYMEERRNKVVLTT